MESVTVRGDTVPRLGLGTFRMDGEECERAVANALELGYRHIDTAEFYENQATIGRAIANSLVDRDELFVTTKVWKTNLRREDVIASTRQSLESLDLEYVDLLLIHWPNEDVAVRETLAAMARLCEDGHVRHIGVSNFSVSQLREAVDVSPVPIFTNQVEYHPLTDRGALREFCTDHGILLTAYSPLAEGRVVDDDTLAEIGDNYDKSPAQVALRWLVQQELVAAIPKASTRPHLAENLDIFDFELTDAEMNRIFELRGSLGYRLRELIGL